jgi:hypothetical protein
MWICLGADPFQISRKKSQNRSQRRRTRVSALHRPLPGTLLINQFTTVYVFLPIIDTRRARFDYVDCGLIQAMQALEQGIQR